MGRQHRSRRADVKLWCPHATQASTLAVVTIGPPRMRRSSSRQLPAPFSSRLAACRSLQLTPPLVMTSASRSARPARPSGHWRLASAKVATSSSEGSGASPAPERRRCSINWSIAAHPVAGPAAARQFTIQVHNPQSKLLTDLHREFLVYLSLHFSLFELLEPHLMYIYMFSS